MRGLGNPYGIHRVLEPLGELPQGSLRLDASLPIFSNEILIDVLRLNVDSTSFRQLWEISAKDPSTLKKRILEIVRERGKLHNPVTHSGGMLIGRVLKKGPDYQGPLQIKEGDLIATLVSLTLTPLHLDEIQEVQATTGQLTVKGHAILFETGIACRLPTDLPEKIALAVLDVCGAPALVLRHVSQNDKVLFIGAGKSALLSAAALRKEWGNGIQITAMDVNREALNEMRAMDLADEVFQGDATQAIFPLSFARRGFDVVINVANTPGTEMLSLMAVRQGGKVIFFGMATSFTKVALGAEGIGKDATFLIGSGYVQGHAELALNLVRENKILREWFERKYAKGEA